MRPPGLSSPCAFDWGSSTALLNNGALSAPRQEFMQRGQHTMLYMRGASTSGNCRVRPCPTRRRTVLVPECDGVAVAPFSPFGTRLASAVMAGDENMEQLSRMKQHGAGSGRRRSSSSLEGQEGRRHEGQGRWQKNAHRGRGRRRGGVDTAVGAALSATPKMQVCQYVVRRSGVASTQRAVTPPVRPFEIRQPHLMLCRQTVRSIAVFLHRVLYIQNSSVRVK